MGDREHWDARHEARRGRAEVAEPFVLEALERLGPGDGRRALDLAAGTGRNALALLEHGWRTSAWDVSPVAGRVLAERSGGRVEWREVDLAGGSLPHDVEPFDLVVLVNFLDRGVLARVHELVRPGGHLVFATFTTERPGERPPIEFCLAPGELASGLPGFETLALREAGGRAAVLVRRSGVAGEELSVERFGPELWEEFLRLHSEANGLGWCRCVAWWTPTWDEFRERGEEQNLAHRRALCAAGEWDGYLALDAGRAVGWCQVGPRDRLGKLLAQHALDPDPEVWAITCVAVAPDRRRTGVARRLLRGALADLDAQCVRRVQAFPRRFGEGRPESGELWTGPEELWLELGFRPWRDDPDRPILERQASAGRRGGSA